MTATVHRGKIAVNSWHLRVGSASVAPMMKCAVAEDILLTYEGRMKVIPAPGKCPPTCLSMSPLISLPATLFSTFRDSRSRKERPANLMPNRDLTFYTTKESNCTSSLFAGGLPGAN